MTSKLKAIQSTPPAPKCPVCTTPTRCGAPALHTKGPRCVGKADGMDDCDCLNDCGDDPWIKSGRSMPCEHRRETQARIAALTTAAPAAVAGPSQETCQTCQGNGEVVTDWERYTHPLPGDVGDEAVAECQDCDGQGTVDAAPTTQPAPRLPERDASIPAEQQGLFRKFDVRRVDGSDQPGGKHHGCTYFVLDLDHDPHARQALVAYAAACESTHPTLSADLRTKWGAVPTAQPAPQQEAQEPVAWRELCRRLYVELFHCDQQMTSGERPKWQQGKTVRDVLADAKAALDAAPQPSPASQGDALDAARLQGIAQAIRDYHFALDTRQHGGVAQDKAFRSIMDVMGMHWVQGAEAAARAAQEGK